MDRLRSSGPRAAHRTGRHLAWRSRCCCQIGSTVATARSGVRRGRALARIKLVVLHYVHEKGTDRVAVYVGEVYENPRCGERVVVRTPAAETGGERTILDVYATPGGAVSGEHFHPISEERFTLVRGKVAFLINGRHVILEKRGQSVLIQPRIKHCWWNCSGEESYHVCEVRHNADRFEQLVLGQLFGLAQDGKTSPEGMPHLLQLAVTTLEYGDVAQFTNQPWAIQRLLLGALVPIARILGLKGCYPEYINRKPSEQMELEPLPTEVAAHHYC